MRPPDHPPPRDVEDRIIRRTLANGRNLRDFLRLAVPDHAPHFDCGRARPLGREFFAEDWRRRESDLLFEIPYGTASGDGRALVYILIEHQSATDALMPLRTLFLALAAWERPWRAWEGQPPPRAWTGLPPVLPIVLYTGEAPWGSSRRLVDLLGEPRDLHAFAPQWEPLFWNLAERTPQGLLDAEGAWPQLLAALRGLGLDDNEFLRLMAEIALRTRRRCGKDHPRWQELMESILTISFWRRQPEERDAILEVVKAVERSEKRKWEITTMGRTIASALIEEGREQQKILSARSILQRLLTKRFGALPKTVARRIEKTADLERLNHCIDQIFELQNLKDLPL